MTYWNDPQTHFSVLTSSLLHLHSFHSSFPMRHLLPLLLLCLHSSSAQQEECGISTPNSNENIFDQLFHKFSRIIGGNESPEGKWPWQILFKTARDDDPFTLYLCGGSIIASRWILTAAHCFDGDRKLVNVVFGSVNSAEKEVNMTAHHKGVIIHKDYEPEDDENAINTTMINDIALIELAESLPFDSLVSPVCLPSINSTLPSDTMAIATGFGLANNRSTRTGMVPAKKLLETALPLIPVDICSDRWQSLIGSTIVDTQLCGGTFGHGTAPGDSGGPLVTKSKSGRWFQIGVTSFGLNREKDLVEQDIKPGVFTNVAKYCDWIEKKTRGDAKCREAQLIDATSDNAITIMSFSIILVLAVL